MKRIALFAVLLAAGCLSPVSVHETAQAEDSVCGPDAVLMSTETEIYAPTPNPWNRHAGVVIYYGDTDNWNLYGVDTNNQIVWMMFNASDAAKHTLQHYPESGADCNGAASNPGSGGGAPPPPDPNLHGAVCVPNSVWADAKACPFKGCSPTPCSDLGGKCGELDDGCGGTVSCGCPNSTDVCGPDNLCRYCKPRRCRAGQCGIFPDGCGGEIGCGGARCVF